MSGDREEPATRRVRVIDAAGKELSSTTPERAKKLVAVGRAIELNTPVSTIQLPETVDYEPRVSEPEPDWTGTRILLHSCCAPCTTYTQKHLRELGFEVAAFWYNPNIYPRKEYTLRRAAMEYFVDAVNLPLIWGTESAEWDEENELWRAAVKRESDLKEPGRCAVCYGVRLSRTAETAAARGFSHFTTTLMVSPYQNLDLIREVGEAVGAKYGVEFYYENFRRGYAESRRLSREHQLYNQKYCGCVYSIR